MTDEHHRQQLTEGFVFTVACLVVAGYAHGAEGAWVGPEICAPLRSQTQNGWLVPGWLLLIPRHPPPAFDWRGVVSHSHWISTHPLKCEGGGGVI